MSTPIKLTTTNIHSQPHAAAPIAAASSDHFPASKARAKHPAHSKLCKANFARLAEMQQGPNPTPEHTHASKHPSCSQHGQGGGTEQNDALGSCLVGEEQGACGFAACCELDVADTASEGERSEIVTLQRDEAR